MLLQIKSHDAQKSKSFIFFIHIIFMFISISSHLISSRVCDSTLMCHIYVYVYTLLLSLGFLLCLTLICLCKAVDVGEVWVWAVNSIVSLSIQRFLNVWKCFQFFFNVFKNILGALLLCTRSVDDAAAYIFLFFCAKVTHFCAHDRCELSGEILWFSLYVCRASAWSWGKRLFALWIWICN